MSAIYCTAVPMAESILNGSGHDIAKALAELGDGCILWMRWERIPSGPDNPDGTLKKLMWTSTRPMSPEETLQYIQNAPHETHP